MRAVIVPSFRIGQRRCCAADTVGEDHVQHKMGASFTLACGGASLEPGSHPIATDRERVNQKQKCEMSWPTWSWDVGGQPNT